LENLNDDISATGHPTHFMYGSRVGFRDWRIGFLCPFRSNRR